MPEWLEQLIPILPTISAILAPVLTGIVNNKHELRMLREKTSTQDNKDVIFKFIDSLNLVIVDSKDPQKRADLNAAFYKLYLIAPEDSKVLLDQIMDRIQNLTGETAQTIFEDILPLTKKLMNSLEILII